VLALHGNVLYLLYLYTYNDTCTYPYIHTHTYLLALEHHRWDWIQKCIYSLLNIITFVVNIAAFCILSDPVTTATIIFVPSTYPSKSIQCSTWGIHPHSNTRKKCTKYCAIFFLISKKIQGSAQGSYSHRVSNVDDSRISREPPATPATRATMRTATKTALQGRGINLSGPLGF